MRKSTSFLSPRVSCHFSTYQVFKTDNLDYISLLDISLKVLVVRWQHFAFTLTLFYLWIYTPRIHTSIHSLPHIWTHQAIIQNPLLPGAIFMLLNIYCCVPQKCMCVYVCEIKKHGSWLSIRYTQSHKEMQQQHFQHETVCTEAPVGWASLCQSSSAQECLMQC